MDFSNDTVIALLAQPKFIVKNDARVDCLAIQSGSALNARYTVLSEDGGNNYLLEIRQSPKNYLNMTLHFQEDDSRIGLIRIDYGSRHKNPEIANEYVPIKMQAYIGKWFDFTEHHIHFHVQGYNTLAWAIPLQADCFPVKELSDFYSIRDAILSFASRINLKTPIQIEERLFL